MNTCKKLLGLTLLTALMNYAHAKEPSLELLKDMLQDEISIKGVSPSPVSGLYEVELNTGVVYLSEDGTHVLSGDLYNLKDDYSYTERKMTSVRKAAISKVKDSDKIIFKAAKEKHKVIVFTDINCGYCTKLHDQMSAYNDAGITIEYLAFPRQGLGSKNEKDMQRIWCSENKAIDLTKAKLKRIIPTKSCKGNQVAEQFMLGQKLGIYATPTIVLSNGELKPGYVKPKELAKMLAKKPTQKKQEK